MGVIPFLFLTGRCSDLIGGSGAVTLNCPVAGFTPKLKGLLLLFSFPLFSSSFHFYNIVFFGERP
jgi:hypothetical protein